MDFNRRFTGGISWAEEFGRQVGRSINALTEDTSPDTSADYVVFYDASDNRPKKVLLDNADLTTTYSAISSDTSLAVDTRYLDTSTADRSHTLPLLSGTTAGDTVAVIAGADGVKIVKHHASDSSGAPMTVLFMKHDYVEFVSTGSAWIKANERFTGKGRLHVTANATISTSSAENFLQSYTVDEDTTGAFDAVTDHRYEHPAAWPNCEMDVNVVLISDGTSLHPRLNVNGTADLEVTESTDDNAATSAGVYKNVKVDAGQYLGVEVYNENASSTDDVKGDAADDESRVVFEIKRWLL